MVNFTHLNTLFQILLKTYFFNSRCVLIFIDPTNHINLEIEIPIIYLTVNNELNPYLIFQHYGCQDIIIHHENATEIFIQFEKLIREKNERFNLRKYIIFGNNAMDIFSCDEIEYVGNILVVVPKVPEEGYDLVTHLYSDKNYPNELVTLDTWFPQNQSFLHGYDLFPDKLYNQNGRQLKIGTFTYEPYSIIEDDNRTFHGTETSFIFEFAKKHNLTPSFTIIDGLWGDIYDNWTGAGILGSLVNDEIDIGYAALYTWEEYYKFLDYTKPLTRTGVTCLVPAPRPAAGWFTPLYSFSQQMWMAILLVLMSDAVVLSFLFYKNYKRWYFEESVMTVIKLYLLQSFSSSIKGKLMTYFIGLNSVVVLLLSSSYGSGLSSVMTVPRYEKAIKTVKDLALSGLQWGAPTDAWLISIRQVEDEDYNAIKRQFVVKNEDNLIASSKLHNFGFSLERLPYGHYAVGPYIRSDIISNYRIMSNDIYWEQCIFMVRKNSVLLPLLDNLILRVFEAGLAAYWENEVVSRYMDLSVQRGIKYYSHVQEQELIKLKWVHVEGAFAILSIGFIASTLIFLLEIFFNVSRTSTSNSVYNLKFLE